MKANIFLRLVLFSILNVYAVIVGAKEVSKQTAGNVALNVYVESTGKSLKNVTVKDIIEIKEKGVTCIYVVEYSVKGFAVIAADDVVKPFIGISLTSDYNEDDLPPAFGYYIIKRLKRQIYDAKVCGKEADEKAKAGWAKYSVPPAVFSPGSITGYMDTLVKTTWHQRWPYNAHCPVDTGACETCNDHVYVGCVATAMAQVLNYWHHPWRGTGSHSYTPEDHPEYGVQTADFGNTYYNFDNMPNDASSYSWDLAELCYHCGVSVDMNYGPDGSGAYMYDVDDALVDYFYFDDDAVSYMRTSFTYNEWLQKLNDNLNANRPVIYAASDDDKGHAWVIAGNQGNDMFYCNWGWGGSYDGWFSIDNLNPDTHHYNDYEEAIFNIHPKQGSLSGTLTLAGSPYVYHYNQFIGSGSQLTIEPGVEIIFDGRYQLVVRGQLNAIGTPADSISFKAQMPVIGMQGVKFENLNDNSMDSSKLVYCKFENGKGDWDKLVRTITTGGSIYCDNSGKVLIEKCSIYNSSSGYGGGIACVDSSNIRLKNNYIHNNAASYLGGGLYVQKSDPVLSGNVISMNYITESSYSRGGGVYCINSGTHFINDIIENNHAPLSAGICLDSCNSVLDSVGINNNLSDGIAGGVLIGEHSDIEFNNCRIYGNIATAEGGGGLYVTENSHVELRKTLLYDNLALYGNAIAANVNSNISVINTTIADNYNSGKDYQNGIVLDSNSSIVIINSILWNNGDSEISLCNDCSISAIYSIIKGGDWTGAGILSSDPLFSSPSTGDYSLTWNGYPIPDTEKSPVIDAGNPTSPLDPDGTRADMGYKPFYQHYTAVSGGDISGTLTCADSPYYVFGDISVPSGDELIIEPCVSIIFQGHYELEVKGRLVAGGTAGNKITFAAADTVDGWEGIRFVNTNANGQDSSKLVNCRITFGNANGSAASDKSGGAISLKASSKVLIKECLLNKNKADEYGGAIYIESCLPAIISNHICGNEAGTAGGGIYFKYCNPVIQGGMIENNYAPEGGACYLFSCKPHFESVTIRNNRAKFGGGFQLYGSASPQFDPAKRCNIYLNYAYAAGLDFSRDMNYWWGTVPEVYTDTFTVNNPNNHFAFPVEDFNIYLQHSVVSQVYGDLYVDENGSDANNGNSPANPLKTMYMALVKTLASETNPVTIHVSQGTFSASNTGERLPVNLRSFVSIEGAGKNLTVFDGENKTSLFYSYYDSVFSVSQMTVKYGNSSDGGGITLDRYSTGIQLSYLDISRNHAEESGGGIAVSAYAYCELDSVLLYYNTADNSGGAVSLLQGSGLKMENSIVRNNSSEYKGGGVEAGLYSDLDMKNCKIYDNEAALGAGIYLNGECLIDSCMIYENNANSTAGYPAAGGGIYFSNSSGGKIHNSQIINNTSEIIAGGIYASGGEVINCKVSGNTATERGGGLYLKYHNTRIVNTEICDNTAVNHNAGAVYCESTSPGFINVTISNNTSNEVNGCGFYCFNSHPTLTNSILWNNFPQEIIVASGDVTAQYCDIEGGYAGTGNIDSSPLFNDAATGDYTIPKTSPCYNAGTPDTTGLSLPLFDLAGNTRIHNDTVDMGAYEYVGDDIFVSAKVFLEGPFYSISMLTRLTSEIPLEQPYNTAPWNYDGNEEVSSIGSNIVDWVIIELRDAPSPAEATASTVLARKAVLLTDGGFLTDCNYSSLVGFSKIDINHNLYFVIKHRNHIAVMSATPVTIQDGIYHYNFTGSPGAAYGTDALKNLGNGCYGMYAGDCDASGTIDAADILLWKNDAGKSGYLPTDTNLDTQTGNSDKNDFCVPNTGVSCQVPE